LVLLGAAPLGCCAAAAAAAPFRSPFRDGWVVIVMAMVMDLSWVLSALTGSFALLTRKKKKGQ
jgi:threonine/homoserine/homoserine lactone efflux protein